LGAARVPPTPTVRLEGGTIPRILIVDDHALIRRGIRDILSDAAVGWTISGEADNGNEAIRLTEMLSPDVVLLDANMPGMSGLDVVKKLRGTGNRAKILLLTLQDSQDLIRSAFKLGINGYLLKTDAEEELVRALRVVLGEGVYLSPKLDPSFVKSVVETISTSSC
jgi:DNA-binding NarL/FixJ family response regulator